MINTLNPTLVEAIFISFAFCSTIQGLMLVYMCVKHNEGDVYRFALLLVGFIYATSFCIALAILSFIPSSV